MIDSGAGSCASAYSKSAKKKMTSDDDRKNFIFLGTFHIMTSMFFCLWERVDPFEFIGIQNLT